MHDKGCLPPNRPLKRGGLGGANFCAFLHNPASAIFAAMTYVATDSPPRAPAQDQAPAHAHAPQPRARRVRHDGWTDTKRAAFLDALGHSGALKDAAAAVGMSRMSVWRLRVRDADFDSACHARQREGVMLLREIAQARARQGVACPIFDANGTQVGAHVRLDCGMLMFLLTRYDMDVIGPPRDPYAAGHASPARKRIMPQSERELRAILAARRVEQAAHIMDEIEDRLDVGDFADLYGTPDETLGTKASNDRNVQTIVPDIVQDDADSSDARPDTAAPPKVTYPLNFSDAVEESDAHGGQNSNKDKTEPIDVRLAHVWPSALKINQSKFKKL